MRNLPKRYAGKYACQWAETYGISTPTARKHLKDADSAGMNDKQMIEYLEQKAQIPQSDKEVIFSYGLESNELDNFQRIQNLLNNWQAPNTGA